MPMIRIMERQDREGNVPLVISTRKGEEKYLIKRGIPSQISNDALKVLQNSHENPFVVVLSEEKEDMKRN